MPQNQFNMTGSGIGQTVGRYGLGAFGGLIGGLPGAWIGSKIGGPLGGLVGGGLSSLFGPHGLGAIGNPGQQAQQQLRGISMLVGNRSGPLTYTGPNNLFGASVPGGAPTGAGRGVASASPGGFGGDNYSRTAPIMMSNQGAPAFARTNTQNILSRNII